MAEDNKIKKANNKSLPQIYVGEEKMSIAQTVKTQVALLALPTPEKYVMQRQGRGGLMLDYVEFNYIIGRLNATFIFDWDTEIIEQIIDYENKQVAMKVRLTVRFANGKEIKKDAWGGSAVKFTKAGEMMDLANDLKGAESDGIKKAASMLGICWDVYSGLTSNGKKKGRTKKTGRTEKKDMGGGFEDMTGPPDTNTEFRTIPITINHKTIMHTKFEALDRFKKAKIQLGKELYYKILGEYGYEKSNQIPQDEIPKLYYAMAEGYKQGREAR